MPSNKQFVISWQAPEFRHYEKTWGWYFAVLAVAILIVGFFIIQKDIFAAITMALLAAFVLIFAKHKPEIIDIELSSKGIRFGNIHFPYNHLKYFWVVHTEHHKTLNFHTNAYVNNVVIIELEDQDPDLIREFLLQYLPEHTEIHPTFAQRISHMLKF